MGFGVLTDEVFPFLALSYRGYQGFVGEDRTGAFYCIQHPLMHLLFRFPEGN